MPLVSVVIPVYNRARELDRALASVRAQTLDDIEIIVVDDGSPEPLNLSQKNLQVIRHPANRGAAAARNTGVAASCGRYIAFLDSDDLWRPEKLARQVAVMEGASREVIGCVTGFALYLGDAEAEMYTPPPVNDWRRHSLKGCRCSPGSTLMFRRDAWQEVGEMDETLRRLEDWDWLLRAARRYRLIALPDTLADIMVGGRPPPAAVEAALGHLCRKHGPELLSRRDRAVFAATVALERASAAAGSCHPLLAAGHTLSAASRDPANTWAHLGPWLRRALYGAMRRNRNPR